MRTFICLFAVAATCGWVAAAPPVEDPEHADVIEKAEPPSVVPSRPAVAPQDEEGRDVVEQLGDSRPRLSLGDSRPRLSNSRVARPGSSLPVVSDLRVRRAARGQPGAAGPQSPGQPGAAGPQSPSAARGGPGADGADPDGRPDRVLRRPDDLAPYPMTSGVHDGGDDWTLAYQDVVHITDADWVRLYFADWELGRASYILIRSLRDDAEQRLDARTIRGWFGSSAFFNGDTVELELYVAPHDAGVFFTLAGVKAGGWIEPPFYRPGVPSRPAPGRSLCGSDNRVSSSESRTGRATYLFGSSLSAGCTAWLLSNGSLATAGHCVDFDPDATPGNCGPQLPDGVVETAFLNGVIEFNVPASQADGTPVLSAPEDQFPVNAVSGFNYDGCGQGLGKDWAIFSISRNATTDEDAHVGRGFFRPAFQVPSNGSTIRITGYGTDSGTANQTNQTSTGPYAGHSTSGGDWWHSYQVDTTGGNSGSPIIRVSNGLTLGIHTNAGCQSDGTGANTGTSFFHNPLAVALDEFPGFGTVYVDDGHSETSEAGSIFKPYDLVPEGVADISSGRVLIVVEGSYTTAEGNAPLTIGADGKRMTIRAPVGNATIGN